MADLKVYSPELLAAASRLHTAGDLLGGLSENRRAIEQYSDGSPNPQLQDGVHEFVQRWELLLYVMAREAHQLSAVLVEAAQAYVDLEAALARGDVA